jgi:polysaccharide export outer membrane protein
MSPVFSVRALRLSLIASLAALALSGCMQTRPLSVAQPRDDLDALAYGQPPTYAPIPEPGSGGAFAALRSGFRGRPGSAVVPVSSRGPAPTYDAKYRLDAGDRLRVVVYGQEGLTNTYTIDAAGNITMPLIGATPARGLTPSSLATSISGRLRNGYIREPSVAVEVEAYRPFFILGEVAAPGQYPYVPNMTVESAVAIAGGFAPRAKRDEVILTHVTSEGTYRAEVPLGTPLSPGDTVQISERWF